jgi:type VII secretion protein EccE
MSRQLALAQLAGGAALLGHPCGYAIGGVLAAGAVLPALPVRTPRARAHPPVLPPPTGAHGPIGTARDGSTLLAVVSVEARHGNPPPLRLALLAQYLETADGVSLATVEATQLLYLTPLGATPTRQTWVTLRLDPARCLPAVTRHGGGADGARRALTWTTARLAARLDGPEQAAAALTPPELAAHLAARTARTDAPGGQPDVPGRVFTLPVGTSDSFAALLEALPAIRAEAIGAETRVRLRRGADGTLQVSPVVRLTAREPGALPRGDGSALRRGAQLDSAAGEFATLSAGHAPRHRFRGASGTRLPALGIRPERLGALPLGATGVPIDSGPDGTPFPLPLFRARPVAAVVVGGTWLVRLLAFRAGRLGAEVSVETGREALWGPVAAALDGRLTLRPLGSPAPPAPGRPDRPRLDIRDCGAHPEPRAVPRPPAPWAASLLLLPYLDKPAALANADLVGLQRLAPEEAGRCAGALRLPDADTAVLPALAEDVALWCTGPAARHRGYVRTRPTNHEREVLGDARRLDPDDPTAA